MASKKREAMRRLARKTISRILRAVPGAAIDLPSTELSLPYRHAAAQDRPRRNPVIAIPGILGSRLVDPESGCTVWGAFGGDYADPSSAEGARLMALPMKEDKPLRDLGDGVRSDGALDRITLKLFGLPIPLRAYGQTLCGPVPAGDNDELLARGAPGYSADEPCNCFQFDYDWRRDIVENAKRLEKFICEKRAYVQRQSERLYGVKDEDVRFDILAYSMGGLLARYFLRYGGTDLAPDGSRAEVTWRGARFVERAILVGTPNAGSLEAFSGLVEGMKPSPFHPRYQPAILGTMPAIYQLLPRSRNGAVVEASKPDQPIEDLLDPELWERMGWGLAASHQDDVLKMLLPHASSSTERRRIALDHQRKCLNRARQFQAALDVPAERPAGLDLYLFAGDGVPTPSVAAVDRGGALKITAYGRGDDTVLRTSALMDERVGNAWSQQLTSPIDWTHVSFLFVDHIKLTKVPAFIENILYLLVDDPREQKPQRSWKPAESAGGNDLQPVSRLVTMN